MGIAVPFLKYDRKGLDVTIEFKAKLNKEEGRMEREGGKEGGKDGIMVVCVRRAITQPAFHPFPPSLPSDLGFRCCQGDDGGDVRRLGVWVG